MPPKRLRTQATEIEAALREREEFEAGFHKSGNGNPTREWEGLQLTVFQRGNYYCWVSSDLDEDDRTFSREKYETQEEAMSGLADYLQVGRL